MKRFPSPYGGVETIIGVFTRDDIESLYSCLLPYGMHGKVLNIIRSKQEILIYSVHGSDQIFEVRVVNH